MIKDSQIFFRIRVNKKSQISQQRKATGYLPSASSAPDTQSPTRPHGTLVRKAATHWEKMWIDFSGISPLGVGFFSVFILMFEECILMFEECTGGLVLLFWGSLGILLYIILYIWITYNYIYVYIISICYMKLEP